MGEVIPAGQPPLFQVDQPRRGQRSLGSARPNGYAEDAQLDRRVWEALHVSHALARSGEFELVHNHLDWLPLAFGEHARAPMVTTIHGFSGAGILPAYTRSRSAFVAISDSDRLLHDGDVAPVQLRRRPVDRRGVIGDKLRCHLVAGSWCGRVDEANDLALVGGGVQEGVA